jgi:predicted NodU family carbamoyl transferase
LRRVIHIRPFLVTTTVRALNGFKQYCICQLLTVLDTESLLGVLSDKSTLEIFTFIANNANVRSQTLRDTYGFSMKQYYSRIQRLLGYGLVKRNLGVYTLSSFGTVVYQNKLKMDAAIKEYNSLKAIDTIKAANDIREKIIRNIVTDNDIKTALLTFPEPTVSTG